MDIILRDVGKVVVNHLANIGYIQATGGNVGGH
jgi:hypothetical protein